MWNFTPVIKIIVAFIKNIPTPPLLAHIIHRKGIRTSLCSRHLPLPLPKCFLHHFFSPRFESFDMLKLALAQTATRSSCDWGNGFSSQFAVLCDPVAFQPVSATERGKGKWGRGSCQLKRLLGCGAIISFQLCKLNLKTFNVTSHAPHKELSCRCVRMRMRMRMPMRMWMRMCEREGESQRRMDLLALPHFGRPNVRLFTWKVTLTPLLCLPPFLFFFFLLLLLRVGGFVSCLKFALSSLSGDGKSSLDVFVLAIVFAIVFVVVVSFYARHTQTWPLVDKWAKALKRDVSQSSSSHPRLPSSAPPPAAVTPWRVASASRESLLMKRRACQGAYISCLLLPLAQVYIMYTCVCACTCVCVGVSLYIHPLAEAASKPESWPTNKPEVAKMAKLLLFAVCLLFWPASIDKMRLSCWCCCCCCCYWGCCCWRI